MEGNYIRLNRKILQWEWYQNINTKILFLHCLLKANWKDGRFEGTTVPRGSFVTSVKQLSSELGLTNDEIRTALKHLLKTGEVTRQTTNKYTVITVCNYDFYQNETKQIPDSSQTGTKPSPDNAQPIAKPFPTIEKGKKERREENKTPPLSPRGGKGARQEPKGQKTQGQLLESLLLETPVSDCLLKSIKEWLEYKKERRFTYKERGLKMLLKQASENAEKYGDKAVASAIRDSIASGYQGIVWEKAKRARQESEGDVGGGFSQVENKEEPEELIGDDW